MKKLLVFMVAVLFTPILYAEDSAVCGNGISLTLAGEGISVTIGKSDYEVRRGRTVISRVLEKSDGKETLVDDEYSFMADNGTSVLRQYVFTGMSWCGDEDSDHPVRVRVYRLNGDQKVLLNDLNCTCQNS